MVRSHPFQHLTFHIILLFFNQKWEWTIIHLQTHFNFLQHIIVKESHDGFIHLFLTYPTALTPYLCGAIFYFKFSTKYFRRNLTKLHIDCVWIVYCSAHLNNKRKTMYIWLTIVIFNTASRLENVLKDSIQKKVKQKLCRNFPLSQKLMETAIANPCRCTHFSNWSSSVMKYIK